MTQQQQQQQSDYLSLLLFMHAYQFLLSPNFILAENCTNLKYIMSHPPDTSTVLTLGIPDSSVLQLIQTGSSLSPTQIPSTREVG